MSDTSKRVDDAVAAGDTKSVIEQLAALSAIEYGRRRKEEAKKIGVTVGALDREVNSLRAKQSTEGNFLPHWRVEPSSEEVDGAVLIDDLCQQFTRYLVLPKKTAPALALWVLHTWVFECFDITPYLSITSPTKRCGKTVLMTMLYWLTCRGKKSDSMSKPAIYRSVEGEKPTLVLDEVGWVLDLKDERQGILCGGFERNGYVEVCEGEGTDITTRRFSTYCPKAFGLIGKLTPTLEDRSIRILMDRKPRGAKVERLRRRDNDEFALLRRRCLRWANDNAKALAQTPPMVLDWLNDRALDFWEPLLTIADQIGGDLPEVAREAAKVLSGEGEGGSEDDVRIELLKDIRRVFGDAEVIRSADLVAQLAADPERPWADWRHGRALTPKQLGGLLRPFGICSETIGPLGAQAKGYKRVHFEEAWDLYCPGENSARAGLAISKRQSVKEPMKPEQPSDFRNVNKRSIDGSKNGNLSYSHAGLDGLTDRNPKPRARASSDGPKEGEGPASAVKGNGDGSGAPSLCAVCKEPEPPPNRASYGGLDVWLHPGCEGEYRRRLDAKSYQGNGKPGPVGELQSPPPERAPVDHYAPGGLMDHVNGVIEGQLRDHEARMAAAKAKQEADQPVEKVPPAQPDQPVSTPDLVPATEVNGLPPRPPGMGDGDWGRLKQRARDLARLRQTDPVAKRLPH
jgi:Protein of unknown function (DUF3631)